jgi:hypothetical protein
MLEAARRNPDPFGPNPLSANRSVIGSGGDDFRQECDRLPAACR